MNERTMPLVVLAVVVIIAIVGLVLLFSGGKTGQAYWSAGGHIQGTPEKTCSMIKEGCEVSQIMGGGANPYQRSGGVLSVECKCPTGYAPPNDYEMITVPMLQSYR